MGGKSKSSTSQSTATTQVDRRIGATDDAIVVMNEGQGADITITQTDHDAVTAAKDIALEGLSLADTTLMRGLGLATAAQDRALDFINEFKVDADERISRLTTQWVGIVALAGLLFWSMRRG